MPDVSAHDARPERSRFDSRRCLSVISAVRTAASANYRFGSLSGKRGRVRARRALARVTGYFKAMIEEIAEAKLRRMERELELRGIRSGRMVARNPGRSSEN
jgi:hypothetical protein